MTTHELCDDILNLCLQKIQLNPRFSIFQLYSAKGLGMHEIESALNTLTEGDPAYLNKIGEIYVLTPRGESFIKNGGFAEQTKREKEEKTAKQERQKLLDNVNKSILDTNESVQATHKFQKSSTRAMIIVAICSLIISFISLLISIIRSQTPPPTILQPQQQISMQKVQDSLSAQLKDTSSVGSLKKKLP